MKALGRRIVRRTNALRVRFLGRRVRLLIVLGLVALVVGGCSSTGQSSDISVKIGDGQASSGNGQFALSIQLLIAVTVLSLVPAILMLATSFTRIVVVLSLLRSAIGIPNLPPNQVLTGLALFLTLFVMAPVLAQANTDALQPYMNNTITQDEALQKGIQPFRDFMLRQTRDEDLQVFIDLSKEARPKTADDVSLEVLLPAFVVSELKTAFTMGFLLYIPFLIIDLVVASALMSMGMVMVSPTQIALPFKLLLFVLVDGWVLVVQSLVHSFG
jgi:flagellar biosynthesis protein FliP